MFEHLTGQYVEAFSNRDLDAISALLAEDFALEDPVVKRIEGKALALKAIAGIFTGCKKLNFSAKNIFQDGDHTIIEFILELDDVRLTGVDVIKWLDGRMCELRAYLDIRKGE
jgi:ketosteroid isomerase-like protein